MQCSIHNHVIVRTQNAVSVRGMRRILNLLTAALVCLVFLPGMAFAQYENGSIVGTVHDGSGAVVADATVKVTNIATGVVSTRQTNESGDYEVPALRVGQYNVEVTKSGFAPHERRRLPSQSARGRESILRCRSARQARR